MSSFVVDDETINKIVSYLHAKAYAPDPITYPELVKMGYDLRFPAFCTELAQKMFDMNITAFQERYGEADGEGFPLPAFKYQFVPASQIEVIKALKTWKYLCARGRVPNLALYQAMDEVHCLLCIDFVEQTEEYKAATWG